MVFLEELPSEYGYQSYLFEELEKKYLVDKAKGNAAKYDQL